MASTGAADREHQTLLAARVDAVDGELRALSTKLQSTNGNRAQAQAAILREAVESCLGRIRPLLVAERAAHSSALESAVKDRSRLKDIILGLHAAAQSDDSADAVTFVFGDSGDTSSITKITQSRALVCQWSQAIQAIVRHGNGLDGSFPKEVLLKDVDLASFEVASDFMISGNLGEQHVRPIHDEVHPVLDFADRFDLRALVDAYFKVLISSEPLTLKRAARILELAVCRNAVAAVDLAAAFLARSRAAFFERDPARADDDFDEANLFSDDEYEKLPPPGQVPGIFFTLSPEAAFAVLKQDDLVKTFSFTEKGIVQLVNLWVEHAPGQSQKADVLLKAVRFELLTLEDLTNLHDELGSLRALGDSCRKQLISTIAQTLKRKIALGEDSAEVDPPRKRRHTSAAWPIRFNTSQSEKRDCRMVRAAFELCGVTVLGQGAAHAY